MFELPYFFGFPLMGDMNFTDRDRQFRNHIVGSIANFAIYQ